MTNRPSDKAFFDYEINGPFVDIYDRSPLLDRHDSVDVRRTERPLAREDVKDGLEAALRCAVSDIYHHTAQRGPLHIIFYNRKTDAQVEFNWSADHD